MRQRVDRKNLPSGVQSRTRETAWGGTPVPDNPEEETPHPLGLLRVCFPEGGNKIQTQLRLVSHSRGSRVIHK